MSAPSNYGIAYTPSMIESLPTSEDKGLEAILSRYSSSIHSIRFQWNDLTNITRCRIIPVKVFRALLASARPGVGIAHAALGSIGSGCAPGFSGTGEYLYTPDMNSARLITYAPGQVSVMGWFKEKSPNADGSFDVAVCPRSKLHGIVE